MQTKTERMSTDHADTISAGVTFANPIQVEFFEPNRQPLVRWLQRLEGAFRVFQVTEDKDKAAYLLHFVGVEAFGILCDRLDPVDPYTQSYGILVGKLKEYYAPEPLEIAEIYIFRKRMQRPDESTQEYMAALQKLSLHCKFGEYLQTELRNQFVFGLRNQRIQSRLLETANVTRDSALRIACGMELAEKGVNKLKEEVPEAAVDFVGAGSKHQRKTKDRGNDRGEQRRAKSTNPGNRKELTVAKTNTGYKPKRQNSRTNNISCFRCGQAHYAHSCTLPRSVKCRECGGFGHLQKVCKKKGQTNMLEEVCRVDEIEHPEHRGKFTASLQVENRKVSFDVDCGSAVTLVSSKWLKRNFPKVTWHATRLKLRSYCKQNFVPLGYVKVKVRDEDEVKRLNMYVVQYDRDPLLGREWINQLNVLKKLKSSLKEIEDINLVEESKEKRLDKLLKKYSKVLSDEFACIKNYKAHLKLKPDAKPVFMKSRTVPFKILEKVERELERMVDAGILEKVESSRWTTPIVPILKKDGGIRICGDFSVTLNPALVVDEHPLPTTEELFASMASGTVFSKIDLKQAYLQLPVEVSDRELLTLNTHKGLFRSTRLMYGTASAPAIWQRTIESILKGIDGVVTFLDDIRIAGKDLKQHLERLELVLKRLEEHNIRINVEKCVFLKDQIEYCGYIIGKNGISKDPKKIEAVNKMPRPTNLTELRAFIGLINYYGRFIKNLSEILYPLNRLLKKGSKFIWSRDCEASFNKVKQEFGDKKILVPFDSKRPLVLATDASPYGVGAVLSHIYPDGTERVIQYASNSLTETQKKYAQIDKEAFAIIFGVKKFHQYLYGNRFTLLTDHKPLAQIFNPQKGLPAYSALRMQHYAVFLQAFNFNIKYRKSEDHGNADGLSRLPIAETRSGEYDMVDIFQIENVNTLPVTASDIRNETNKDTLLGKIQAALEKGKSLKALGYKDQEFALQDGIIFRKERVVIPKVLRNKVLQELHAGHFGTVRMKQLGRNYCWWPNMDKEIESITKNCNACNTFSNNPNCKIKHHWEAATQPFERVHIDFAGPFLGHNFLVLVDAYTKWPEVHLMKNITAENTIDKCREIFTTFGLPHSIVTDNGRTFIAKEFKEFVKSNGICHKRTAPYHPATNGLAERFVQTLKQALRKLNITNGNIRTNLQKFLFHYRLTPHAELGKSPAEAMLGRKLRSRLDLMFPETDNNVSNMSKTKVPKVFKKGERVAVREYLDKNIKWRFGWVTKKLGTLHYEIKLDNGKIWKRHINQMRGLGKDIVKYENDGDSDYDKPGHMSYDVVNSETNSEGGHEPQNFTSDASGDSQEKESTDFEEGGTAGADVPLVNTSPNGHMSEGNQHTVNSENEGRPQRTRKPPERYGIYLNSF